MRLRAAWVVALTMAPAWAMAHSPVKGVMPFYGGILHPFVVPPHLIAMVGLGLLAGQHAPREAFGRVALALFLTLVAGVALSGVLGDPDTDLPLLAASTLVALAVCSGRRMPPAVVAVAAAAVGLLLGLGSGPEGLIGTVRWLTLAGTCLGVFVGVSWVFIVAERARRPWQKIAVRVVGSWIAASAVIVLALGWVGPQRPAAVAAVTASP